MFRKIVVSYLAVVFMVGVASASFISLNTTVKSKIEGNTLQVFVSTINKGDEAAHNVQAEIRVGDKKILAKKKVELGIDKTYKAIVSFDLDYKSPGQYPLVVIMHYADANQYPFSALTLQTFPYKSEATPSDLFGRMKGSSFWKTGKAKLTLKNMGDADIDAATKLVVPRELTVAEGQLEMDIASKSEKQISFTLENFSALSGSSYQVFAVSEYEKDGVHQTNITPGMMRIVQSREIFGINYTAIIAALILLILFFIAAQFFKKK